MQKLGRAVAHRAGKQMFIVLFILKAGQLTCHGYALFDTIARFGKQENMPREFFVKFVLVAQEEGRHFILLAAWLNEIGYHYGALPAHDGLWDSATATSHDILAARELHIFPTTISRSKNGGDNETADLMENVVYPEEITYRAAGVKWFTNLCARSKHLEFTINS